VGSQCKFGLDGFMKGVAGEAASFTTSGWREGPLVTFWLFGSHSIVQYKAWPSTKKSEKKVTYYAKRSA
jgi:hypothetical protein